VGENPELLAQACARDLGMISVRLATGIVTTTKKVEVELPVQFADFDSVESFTILDMDGRFDLILGMPWLQRDEPWIDWRTRSIGSSTPGESGALVSNDPTFALHQRSKRTREARSVQEHCGAVADTPMGVALKETQDQGPNVDTLRCRKPPYMLEPVLASGSHVPRKTREPSGPAPVVKRSLLPTQWWESRWSPRDSRRRRSCRSLRY